MLLRNALWKMSNQDFEIQNVSLVRRKHSKEIPEKNIVNFKKYRQTFSSKKAIFFRRLKSFLFKYVHSFYRTIFLSFMYRALIFGIFIFWCYELYWGKKLTFLCKINNLFLKIFKVFFWIDVFQREKMRTFFWNFV